MGGFGFVWNQHEQMHVPVAETLTLAHNTTATNS